MKKLSSATKRHNKTVYKAIRRTYEEIKDKADVSYLEFKRYVKARMEGDKLNYRQAIRKEANSNLYVSAAERSRTNLIQGIRENFKETYSNLRELARDEHGRFRKIEDILDWDEDRGLYTITGKYGKYAIITKDSPKQVYVNQI